MRKRFLFVGLLATCFTASQAQRSYFGGLKAGANIYNLNVNNAVNYKARTSVHAGMFFNIPFKEDFSIQPELIYSGEGAKFTNAAAVTKNTMRLQYVNIPVMLQFKTTVGFYAEIGPQFGILVQGRQLITDKAGVESSIDLLSKEFKNTAISAGIGLGYRKGMIGGNVRYNHGLSNLSKIDANPEMTSSGFQVGLAVWFKQ
ncbi:MAG: opacity protein [Flaviaesturariibacter sp.]|nr:opacity protein [Flaviaesturariibacter sp.]